MPREKKWFYIFSLVILVMSITAVCLAVTPVAASFPQVNSKIRDMPGSSHAKPAPARGRNPTRLRRRSPLALNPRRLAACCAIPPRTIC